VFQGLAVLALGSIALVLILRKVKVDKSAMPL